MKVDTLQVSPDFWHPSGFLAVFAPTRAKHIFSPSGTFFLRLWICVVHTRSYGGVWACVCLLNVSLGAFRR